MDDNYFRILARRCLEASRGCFDLQAKEEFRRLAEELARKADELDHVDPAREHKGEPE